MTATIRIVMVALFVMLLLAAADVARADHGHDEWEIKNTLPSGVAESIEADHPQPEPEPTPLVPVSGVEQWRPHVATYFPETVVDDALSVMWCESRGNPTAKNPRSSAAGLFQFIRSTWDWVAPNVGADTYGSGAVFEPVTNIRAAAWLWSRSGTFIHWECKPWM